MFEEKVNLRRNTSPLPATISKEVTWTANSVSVGPEIAAACASPPPPRWSAAARAREAGGLSAVAKVRCAAQPSPSCLGGRERNDPPTVAGAPPPPAPLPRPPARPRDANVGLMCDCALLVLLSSAVASWATLITATLPSSLFCAGEGCCGCGCGCRYIASLALKSSLAEEDISQFELIVSLVCCKIPIQTPRQ